MKTCPFFHPFLDIKISNHHVFHLLLDIKSLCFLHFTFMLNIYIFFLIIIEQRSSHPFFKALFFFLITKIKNIYKKIKINKKIFMLHFIFKSKAPFFSFNKNILNLSYRNKRKFIGSKLIVFIVYFFSYIKWFCKNETIFSYFSTLDLKFNFITNWSCYQFYKVKKKYIYWIY